MGWAASRTVGVMLSVGLPLVVGCGQDPAQRARRLRDDATYAQAERAFAHRDDREARRLFTERAQRGASDRSLARFRLAELDERTGDLDSASAQFRAVTQMANSERAALALFRLAQMDLHGGDTDGACARWFELADTRPQTAAADKAVRHIAGECVAPISRARTSAEQLGALAERHAERDLGDNAAWWRSEVQLRSLGDLGAARTTLRAMVARWPESPLLDDALWRLAKIQRRQGAWRHAIRTLEALIEVRDEHSYLVGTYRSVYLDDAQLAIGWIYLAELREPDAALEAFDALVARFSTSVLVDDALWGRVVALKAAGSADAPAAATRLLHRFPDSRHADRARAVLEGSR